MSRHTATAITLLLACSMNSRGAFPNWNAAPNQGIQPPMQGGEFGFLSWSKTALTTRSPRIAAKRKARAILPLCCLPQHPCGRVSEQGVLYQLPADPCHGDEMSKHQPAQFGACFLTCAGKGKANSLLWDEDQLHCLQNLDAAVPNPRTSHPSLKATQAGRDTARGSVAVCHFLELKQVILAISRLQSREAAICTHTVFI